MVEHGGARVAFEEKSLAEGISTLGSDTLVSTYGAKYEIDDECR